MRAQTRMFHEICYVEKNSQRKARVNDFFSTRVKFFGSCSELSEKNAKKSIFYGKMLFYALLLLFWAKISLRCPNSAWGTRINE
jgi:hypothetical protein